MRLDLLSFACQLQAEPFLDLIHNSRDNDLPARVRRVRYENGVVDYCHRHHSFSLWAENAPWLGWLQPLTLRSRHPSSYRPMRQAHNRPASPSRSNSCWWARATFRWLLCRLPQPACAAVDLFALLTCVAGLEVTHTGCTSAVALSSRFFTLRPVAVSSATAILVAMSPACRP